MKKKGQTGGQCQRKSEEKLIQVERDIGIQLHVKEGDSGEWKTITDNSWQVYPKRPPTVLNI